MEPGAPPPVNAAPPYGHVICCEKWRNSTLVQNLKARGVRVLLEKALGVADFQLSNRRKILYVSECDLVAASSYKRKLLRFRNSSSSFQELVLVETSRLSQQYFPAVQKTVVLDLGLSLLPVDGQTEAAQLIAQMIYTDGRDTPFRRRTLSQMLDPVVLAVVQQVPGVGRVKALALLRKFSSVHEICSATLEQLEPVVGPAGAKHIYHFFHSQTAAGT